MRDALDDWIAAGDAPLVVVDVFLVLLLEDLGDLVLLCALVLLRIGILLDPRNGTLLEFCTLCWKPSSEITIVEIMLGSDEAKY